MPTISKYKKSEVKNKSTVEFRKKVDDTLTDEEIDRIFDVRDHSPDTYESHVFDGVFDD
jgi:hypothetical protein